MVTIAAEALERLETLLLTSPGTCLRVWVEPGGCSGFSYGMGLDEAINDDDERIALSDTATLLMDAFSASVLDGSEIDYIDSLMGGGFTVHNPNAVSTCSCGSSFSTGTAGEHVQACTR